MERCAHESTTKCRRDTRTNLCCLQPHFAARWAVKEAFLKAYGVKFIGNHRLPEIETVKDEHGNPDIKLSGETLKGFKEKGFAFAHVSISHTDSHAMAYVIIEK